MSRPVPPPPPGFVEELLTKMVARESDAWVTLHTRSNYFSGRIAKVHRGWAVLVDRYNDARMVDVGAVVAVKTALSAAEVQEVIRG